MVDLDARARMLMERLNISPFTALRNSCENEQISPGFDDPEEWGNWIDNETTADQLRIEECLETMINDRASILHVGVGNSSLASRFSSLVYSIYGITLYTSEQKMAESFQFSNYTVRITNKYSKFIVEHDHSKLFKFIVDNNPSSFACCLFHFCRMMINYRDLLCVGGELLTDELGLSWVAKGGNAAWSFNWREWTCLGEALGMQPRRITQTVYSLVRTD